MSKNLIKEFHTSIACMIDLKCWKASCVIWGLLHLCFGEEYVRNYTTPGGKNFTAKNGECDVVLWCPWRLEETGIVTCSSHPQFSNSVKVLDLLIDDRIDKIEIYIRCYDAIFYFASGKILRIFSDHLKSSKNFSNWEFTNVMDECFFLGCEDAIKKECFSGAPCNETTIPNKINEQTALIKGEEKFYKDMNFIKKHRLNAILGFVCVKIDILSDEELLLSLENTDPETRASSRLLISHCAWRFGIDDAFLCSSDSTNSIQQNGLKIIRNDFIVDLLNKNHENDIEVKFSSGATLRIFNLLNDFPLSFI